MAEVWRLVRDWPYQVSNQGRVRNLKSGRVLKLTAHKSGYQHVQLWNKRKYRTFLVHVLVAEAFLPARPSPAHEVAHGDGDRHNNRSSNLRWATHLENMADRDKHGTTARGRRNGKLKHSDEVVARCRELADQGWSIARIAAEVDISASTVFGYTSRTRRTVVAGGAP
ncbi:TPA: NUMOD4 motif-containing HNH endonuclease [Pseudomonas aeruginosa]|uniref:NUMOD4 motif-containing HNH endonuclease n=1 Tax=unclassified Pseudomonas TaxID=196821 RepID=UPI002157CDD4|nr:MULTISPECIES: NUMOD4 motif-containing HNH endonuclease [unclassified Pseudomonas]HBN9515506.1 NUMOD4 motif-containing HNH endonuclease [Pseudomonas aeruginosa]